MSLWIASGWLQEPESFAFELDGEKIVGVDLRMGYAHRGIEKAFEDRTFIQGIYLAERICGICSTSHSTPFCLNAEEVLKLEVPKRAQYIRALVGELERVHSHLLWLGVAGHEVGFDSLFMYTWRDREIVQDMLELISGNRVHYGMNTIGGVRRDINAEQIAQLRNMNKIALERTEYYSDLVEAYAWVTAAGENNVMDGFAYRSVIIRDMSPEQIAEGKRRAAQRTKKETQ